MKGKAIGVAYGRKPALSNGLLLGNSAMLKS